MWRPGSVSLGLHDTRQLPILSIKPTQAYHPNDRPKAYLRQAIMRGRVWDLFPPSQTDRFNVFDELATLDVTSDIHGPQLIIVRDQNSGKSSVLEAIALPAEVANSYT